MSDEDWLRTVIGDRERVIAAQAAEIALLRELLKDVYIDVSNWGKNGYELRDRVAAALKGEVGK